MPGDFFKVPVFAGETNYPVSANPWSGTATKVQPSGTFQSYGWTPGVPPPAQYENWLKAQMLNLDFDNQRNAAIKVVAGGIDTATPAHARWMPLTHRIGLIRDTLYNVYSPDFRRTKQTAVVANLLNAIKGAVSKIGTHRVGYFERNVTGGVGTLDVYMDDVAGARTIRDLPNVNAIYTHACTDETTGRFVAVAGNSALAANVGFASSDLSVNPAFALAVIPFVWVPQPNMSVASKPGETRAFSYFFTFATTNGGVSVSGPAQSVGFFTPLGDPPFSPNGNLFPPTWDPAYNRWVTSIAKLSVSSADSAANNFFAYSEDGIDWRKLADGFPGVVMTTIVAHRGWLWGIGRCLPDYAGGHGGLEVFFSTDGGVNWSRPGIVLSFVSLGFGATEEGHYHHASSIVPMGSHILFQTTISQPTDAGWVTGTPGKGLEYVVLEVDWDG